MKISANKKDGRDSAADEIVKASISARINAVNPAGSTMKSAPKGRIFCWKKFKRFGLKISANKKDGRDSAADEIVKASISARINAVNPAGSTNKTT